MSFWFFLGSLQNPYKLRIASRALYMRSTSSKRSGFTPPPVSSDVSLCRFEVSDDGENNAIVAKCNAAANHITSIGKNLKSLPADMQLMGYMD